MNCDVVEIERSHLLILLLHTQFQTPSTVNLTVLHRSLAGNDGRPKHNGMGRERRPGLVNFSRLSSVRIENQRFVVFVGNDCYIVSEHCSFIENNISGEVLCMLDSEGLKDVGVTTIGQRLAILKAVYQVKLAQNVPIDADHYVPPCAFPFHLNQPMTLIYYSAEAQDRENMTLDRLYDIVKNQSLS